MTAKPFEQEGGDQGALDAREEPTTHQPWEKDLKAVVEIFDRMDARLEELNQQLAYLVVRAEPSECRW